MDVIIPQQDKYFFNQLGNALDKYTQNYEKFLLASDFNAEDFEPSLSNGYMAQNIVKQKTCFKSLQNPGCVN